MSTRTVRCLEAVEWKQGLRGEFPGQQSYIELGAAKVRMLFCWCPPPEAAPTRILNRRSDEGDRSRREGYRGPGFWLAKHPVNNAQYREIMEKVPSQSGKSDLHPVDSVSWHQAREFCQRAGLRLPTEAEWEYACRAGSTTVFGIGHGDSLNSQMANFDGGDAGAFKWLYREQTLIEGAFPPNAWGLHDMHGQLWEWCADATGEGGSERVLRGGSWFSSGWRAGSATLFGYGPADGDDYIGFRPCPGSIQVEAGLAPVGSARRGERSEGRA